MLNRAFALHYEACFRLGSGATLERSQLFRPQSIDRPGIELHTCWHPADRRGHALLHAVPSGGLVMEDD